MPPLSPITERERLQHLVSAQPIHLKLRGLLWEDSMTVAEIISPHTRRSPFMNEGKSHFHCESDSSFTMRTVFGADLLTAFITHLDTISCWKGLSHSQASELLVWYHIFSDCLTFLVEEALRDVLVDELLASQGESCHFSCIEKHIIVLSAFESMLMLRHREFDRSVPGAAYT
jgi:hypothetical protein